MSSNMLIVVWHCIRICCNYVLGFVVWKNHCGGLSLKTQLKNEYLPPYTGSRKAPKNIREHYDLLSKIFNVIFHPISWVQFLLKLLPKGCNWQIMKVTCTSRWYCRSIGICQFQTQFWWAYMDSPLYARSLRFRPYKLTKTLSRSTK